MPDDVLMHIMHIGEIRRIEEHKQGTIDDERQKVTANKQNAY